MASSTNSVREFFDNISDTYGEKYSGSDPFYEYFFRERLMEATRDIPLKGKTILDIGAGTGSLYDHLVGMEPDVEYYGTDISSGMLAQSSIPEGRRFLGKIGDLDLPVKRFDLVFLLGVTTYLDEPELRSTLDVIDDLLGQGGLLIITFTNGTSVDWKVRQISKRIFRGLLSTRKVLGQTFPVYPRRIEEMKAAFGNGYTLDEIRLLNHTVFPVNQLLKKPSIWFARRLHSAKVSTKVKTWLSSDFMLVLQKAGTESS